MHGIDLHSFSLSYERQLIKNLSIQPEISYWGLLGILPRYKTYKEEWKEDKFQALVQARYYFLLNKRNRLEGFYASFQVGLAGNRLENRIMSYVNKRILGAQFGPGVGLQINLWKGLTINWDAQISLLAGRQWEANYSGTNIYSGLLGMQFHNNFRIGYSF